MGRCRFPARGKGQNLQWATCYMRRLLECEKRFQMEAIITIWGLSLEALHTLALIGSDSTYIELVEGLGQAFQAHHRHGSGHPKRCRTNSNSNFISAVPLDLSPNTFSVRNGVAWIVKD